MHDKDTLVDDASRA